MNMDAAAEPNIMFPGRPNYTGPTTGLFGLLHHDRLYEASDNVMERVAYVRRDKPRREVSTRLHNMIYLGGCEAVAKLAPLDADYDAKIAPLYTAFKAKRAPLDADYRAKRAPFDAYYWAKRALLDAEITDYILQHIPDCAWCGVTLVFPGAKGRKP